MKLHRCLSSVVVILALATAMPSYAQQSANSEWKPVEDALGRKGSPQPGDVYKFSMPRSDMKVTVAGTPIKAGLALGSRLAFKRMGNERVVRRDLLLTEAEHEAGIGQLE